MNIASRNKRIPEGDKLSKIVCADDESKFEVILIDKVIGYGVFAKVNISKEEPLLSYRGDILTKEEGEKRRQQYINNNEDACFLYDLTHNNEELIVDATKTPGICKLVNDSPTRFSNCCMKKKIIDFSVHLVLYSVSDIKIGEELRYSYGDKEVLPWRNNEVTKHLLKPLTKLQVISRISKTTSEEIGILKEKDVVSSKASSTVTEVACNSNSDKGVISTGETTVTQDQSILEAALFDSLPDTFLNKIGEGTAALLYKYDNGGSIPLAVKVFREPPSKKRILKIASKVLKLSHENVLQLIGYSFKPVCLLTEYCSLKIGNECIRNVGKLISVFNEEKDFHFDERCNIVLQICKGLNYLHENRIIHKDIKPANLLVTGNCRENLVIKIADFDDAYYLKTLAAATMTIKQSPFHGLTLMYTANEICLQQVLSPSFKSDIYALGITAYEVFTGVIPAWTGVLPILNDILLLSALQQDKRPKLEVLGEIYSQADVSDIKVFIETCWDPNPDNRPSAKEAIDMLIVKKAQAAVESNQKLKINDVSENEEEYLESFHAYQKKQNVQSENKIINNQVEFAVEWSDKKNVITLDFSSDEEEDEYKESLINSFIIPEKIAMENSEKEVNTDLPLLERSIEEKSIRNDSGFQLDPDLSINDTHEECSTEEKEENFRKETVAEAETGETNGEQDKATELDGNNSSKRTSKKEECSTEEKEENFQKETDKEEKTGEANGEQSDEATELDENKSSKKTSKKKKKKKNLSKAKPDRLCIFCKKMIKNGKLSRHITGVHRNHPEVAKAIDLPEAKRNEKLGAFKRQGILEVNLEEAKKANPKYHRERKALKHFTTRLCSNCKKFVSSRNFNKHLRRCLGDSCQRMVHIPARLLEVPEGVNLDKDFEDKILKDLADDELGRVCRRDEFILQHGSVLFKQKKNKRDKMKQVKTYVRKEMRQTASLYIAMKEMDGFHNSNGSASDIFNRLNFPFLSEAIETLTTDEKKKLKAGKKLSLLFTIKKAAKVYKALLLTRKEDSLSDECEKFVQMLELWEGFLFSDAQHSVKLNRQKNLRKPNNLPDEEDIKLVRKFTISEVEKLLGDPYHIWDRSSFVRLRDCVLTRLTLLNARRGGEAVRLKVEDWQDALNDKWIDQRKFKSLSPDKQKLIQSTKVAYITGKGNNSIVPLLIPAKLIESLEILCDPDVRRDAHINQNNENVFPSTGASEDEVSGWHSLHSICSLLPLKNPSNLKATTNRHRVSTLYAELEVPEDERHYFYKHMGHSAEVNKNVYQDSLAIMEVLIVGEKLLQMEGAECASSSATNQVASNASSSGMQVNEIDPVCCSSTPKLEKKYKKGKRKSEIVSDLSDSDTDTDLNISENCRAEQRDSSKSHQGLRTKKRSKRSKRKIEEVSSSENEEDFGSLKPSKKVQRKRKSVQGEGFGETKILKRSKASVRWTKEISKDFFKKFGSYVDRTNKKKMPDTGDMLEFVEKHKMDCSPSKVRTKINNERLRIATNRERNLKELNIAWEKKLKDNK